MDIVAWIVLAAAVVAACVGILLAPRLARENLRRQREGGGGAFGGVGAGMDAVWRPSAEEAHARWEAQVELPAPAPSPGDRGLDDGPFVIDVVRQD